MKIISEDCYIEYKKGYNILCIPKTKKELKEKIEGEVEEENSEFINENIDPKFKIIGYYSEPINAIYKIVKIRKDKKYKLKQPYEELQDLLKRVHILYKVLHYSISFTYKIKLISFKLNPNLLVGKNPTKVEKALADKKLKHIKKQVFIQNNIKKIYENICKKFDINNKEYEENPFFKRS